jgi:hypothetical protein
MPFVRNIGFELPNLVGAPGHLLRLSARGPPNAVINLCNQNDMLFYMASELFSSKCVSEIHVRLLPITLLSPPIPEKMVDAIQVGPRRGFSYIRQEIPEEYPGGEPLCEEPRLLDLGTDVQPMYYESNNGRWVSNKKDWLTDWDHRCLEWVFQARPRARYPDGSRDHIVEAYNRFCHLATQITRRARYVDQHHP